MDRRCNARSGQESERPSTETRDGRTTRISFQNQEVATPWTESLEMVCCSQCRAWARGELLLHGGHGCRLQRSRDESNRRRGSPQINISGRALPNDPTRY